MPLSVGQYTSARTLAVGTGEAEAVVRELKIVGKPPGNDKEGVDNAPLSEVLGKPGDTVTELRDILRPVGIAREVLGALSVPDNDNVGKLGDSVGKLSDSVAEL